ncbi:unnamed protein product [marine sediment metagenome]|uniref:Uncharacterized protein n=1 Tax=marine sediment metagenome TaxID=412755 RepID=X1AN02_9ZZZZ
MIFGVHWENVGSGQIDLDLSLLSPTTGKLGWDAGYRSESGDILYSGDVTTAPKPDGATELFYVKKQLKDEFIFFVNYYNYDPDILPFSIFRSKKPFLINLSTSCKILFLFSQSSYLSFKIL